MTRATVEDSTARLGQPLRAGRPLVGGLSFQGVVGLCTSSLVHRFLEKCRLRARGRRPMQAWVSCSGRRITACGPHALVGDPCPDLKHGTTRPSEGNCQRQPMKHPSEVGWMTIGRASRDVCWKFRGAGNETCIMRCWYLPA